MVTKDTTIFVSHHFADAIRVKCISGEFAFAAAVERIPMTGGAWACASLPFAHFALMVTIRFSNH